MKILGIETSCDETAAAVIEDGRTILSNVVVSQIDIFAAYGGVIPEVAARSHLEAIMPVIDKALSDANLDWPNIDAIAVTFAPGLLGSLLIGTLTARTLAILHHKPLYAVHHLKSHIYANWLTNSNQDNPQATPQSETILNEIQTKTPSFPLISLVVSGGHTQILYMPRHDHFEIIGTTRDDAVGECFDKVAKILGLPYPGGPAIANAASGLIKLSRPRPAGETELKSGDLLEIDPGDPDKYPLPKPKVDGLDFSFSGLKTAVLRSVQKELKKPISFPSYALAELLAPKQIADFAASFQKTAVENLVEKLEKAVNLVENNQIELKNSPKNPKIESIVLAGGVAANQVLREAALNTFPDREVWFPALSLSGDNGAMVAAAAYYELKSGKSPVDPYKLNIYPRISIED